MKITIFMKFTIFSIFWNKIQTKLTGFSNFINLDHIDLAKDQINPQISIEN